MYIGLLQSSLLQIDRSLIRFKSAETFLDHRNPGPEKVSFSFRIIPNVLFYTAEPDRTQRRDVAVAAPWGRKHIFMREVTCYLMLVKKLKK